MSAFGPKRTFLVALHMSALGGKADMASQLNRKSTWHENSLDAAKWPFANSVKIRII
jgi:hypothetical protein